MNNTLVFATSNKNKIFEAQAKFDFEKINIKIEPVRSPFEPVENGKNFIENAIIKAKEAAKIMNKTAFADDSGLCVDYLNGNPGIYSARYAPTQNEKIDKILYELKECKNIEERTAHFACAVALVDKKGEVLFSHLAKCHGYITFERQGEGGFGYDPIFLLKGLNKTFGELTTDEKNLYSHRSKALNELIKFLK